jgi:hypothetical protein
MSQLWGVPALGVGKIEAGWLDGWMDANLTEQSSSVEMIKRLV